MIGLGLAEVEKEPLIVLPMKDFTIPETRLMVHRKQRVFQVHVKLESPAQAHYLRMYSRDADMRRDLKVVLHFLFPSGNPKEAVVAALEKGLHDAVLQTEFFLLHITQDWWPLQDMFKFYHETEPVTPNPTKFIVALTFLPDRALELTRLEKQQRLEDQTLGHLTECASPSPSSSSFSSSSQEPSSPPREIPHVAPVSLKSKGEIVTLKRRGDHGGDKLKRKSALKQSKAKRKLVFFPLSFLGSIAPTDSDDDPQDASSSPFQRADSFDSSLSSSLPQTVPALSSQEQPSGLDRPTKADGGSGPGDLPGPGLSDWFRSWFS